MFPGIGPRGRSEVGSSPKGVEWLLVLWPAASMCWRA